MTLEIQEDIESAVDYQREQLTPEIRTLIRNCNADLCHGPVYLNEAGERVSYLDEGAKAFPFVSSCDAIREALAGIEDIEVEVSYDAETDESEFERKKREFRKAQAALIDAQREYDLADAKSERALEEYDALNKGGAK